MNEFKEIDDQHYLFGGLFVVSNKLDTLLERELSQFEMTSKQWFLLLNLGVLFVSPPTMKEVAQALGTSHQNVKQLALKLEQKGLLAMEKDPHDARVTRLKLTEKNQIFWEQTEAKGLAFINAVFQGIAATDLAAARRVIQQLWTNLSGLEEMK